MLGIKQRGWGSIKIFRRKFFLSHNAEYFVWQPFVQCFRNFPVAKRFLDKGGGAIKIFRRKIFLSQCPKISQWNLLLLY